MNPKYLQLDTHTLQDKIKTAVQTLSSCTICPRTCKVDRKTDETGFCGSGRYAHLASYHLHLGEEPQIVGKKGSGTIFFAGCNLGCIFCQNFDISRDTAGFVQALPEQLARIMLDLQNKGAHNINLVTPTHVVPQILEALPLAIKQGLNIPLVYNCGGYESLETLKILDGVVDIYMPDIKFTDPSVAEKYCQSRDYPEKSALALKDMQRQVGDLQCDSSGVATSGLLLRHLIMPNQLASTESWVRFVSREISPYACLHLMEQYHPAGNIQKHPELQRRISMQEYLRALEITKDYGLKPLQI